ncbi:MAG: YopT-type cysteine protease domain-containing protein [Chlamydiota bacterium]
MNKTYIILFCAISFTCFGDQPSRNLVPSSEIIQDILSSTSSEEIYDRLQDRKDLITSLISDQILLENNPPSTVFMDLDHKDLRVIAEYIYKTELATIGTILTCTDKNLSENDIDRYLDLAFYQRAQSEAKLKTLSIFGNNIVDFSFNALPRFLKSASMEDLENLYGKELLCKWMNLSTDKLYIDKTDVIPSLQREMFRGRCYGMSLDFLTLYLEKTETHANLSSLDVIKSIAGRFSIGASDRAEMAQICQELAVPSFTDKDLSTWNAPKSSRKYTDRSDNTLDLISKGFGLTRGEGLSIDIESNEFTKDSLANLSQGACLVILDLESGVRHAIALIKAEEENFYLFDPNYATLSFESKDAFDNFENLLHLYRKNPVECMRIYPIRLAQNN